MAATVSVFVTPTITSGMRLSTSSIVKLNCEIFSCRLEILKLVSYSNLEYETNFTNLIPTD